MTSRFARDAGIRLVFDDAARAIPTFTVLVGEADPQELERIAALTGGQVFDARESTLTQAFEEIRGYQ